MRYHTGPRSQQISSALIDQNDTSHPSVRYHTGHIVQCLGIQHHFNIHHQPDRGLQCLKTAASVCGRFSSKRLMLVHALHIYLLFGVKRNIFWRHAVGLAPLLARGLLLLATALVPFRLVCDGSRRHNGLTFIKHPCRAQKRQKLGPELHSPHVPGPWVSPSIFVDLHTIIKRRVTQKRNVGRSVDAHDVRHICT